VNPRACGYTMLNAALNDVRIDVRIGSLLEPVEGEAFDLLVSNPPYVLSPEKALVFRDNGYPGDSFNRLVASSVSSALAPGGTAVVLLSWSQPLGVRQPSPLGWLDGVDADALLVLTGMADAVTEAGSWNREFAGDPERYARQVERWLAWYTEQGIEQIGYGALTLRRPAVPRTAKPWRFALPGEPRSGPCGDHVDRILSAHAQMEDIADAALLSSTLRLRPGTVLRATAIPEEGGWTRSAALGIEPGLGVTAPVTPQQEQVLFQLSASEARPVGALTELLPTAALVEFVRGLVEAGFAELGGVAHPTTATQQARFP
jgi:hypothetical protein